MPLHPSIFINFLWRTARAYLLLNLVLNSIIVYILCEKGWGALTALVGFKIIMIAITTAIEYDRKRATFPLLQTLNVARSKYLLGIVLLDLLLLLLLYGIITTLFYGG